MNRHEIPTHLNVEDKAFAGLTMRQLMTAAVGLGMAYGTASDIVNPKRSPPAGAWPASFRVNCVNRTSI